MELKKGQKLPIWPQKS